MNIKNNNSIYKDLITTGIFSAVYFAVYFITGMLISIPILLLIRPFMCTLLVGIPFMLFVSKISHFGMVTVMGSMMGLIMFATGHTWIPIPMGALAGFLADTIMHIKKYRNININILGFCIFSLWTTGAMLPFFVLQDSFLEARRATMGDEYVDAIIKYTPIWMIFILMASIIIAALIGGIIGKAVLKKHFKKAGLV